MTPDFFSSAIKPPPAGETARSGRAHDARPPREDDVVDDRGRGLGQGVQRRLRVPEDGPVGQGRGAERAIGDVGAGAFQPPGDALRVDGGVVDGRVVDGEATD